MLFLCPGVPSYYQRQRYAGGVTITGAGVTTVGVTTVVVGVTTVVVGVTTVVVGVTTVVGVSTIVFTIAKPMTPAATPPQKEPLRWW